MGSFIKRNQCNILMELIIINNDININWFWGNSKVLFWLILIQLKKKTVSYLCSNMQRSLTVFPSPFKDQSFLEKTPLSHVHNFLKKCADFPLMITCEYHSQPTIQPIEYSLMLNPPPIYEHLAIYSVNYIKRLNMITCSYFFTKYATKPIYLWFSIFSPFVLIRSPYEISTKHINLCI